MLSGFTYLAERLRLFVGGLQRPTPPDGSQYRLFDLGILVACVSLGAYIAGSPAIGTQQTLSWLLGPTAQVAWGASLFVAGITAAVCSYRHDWMPLGLGVLAAACFVWTGALVVGLFIDFTGPGFASAVLWGYLTRQAWQIAADG